MTDAARPVVERTAVRALILTPERDVLLMRIRSPNTGKAFWVLPGGGLDAGESDADGLARELREELGLTAYEMGPLIWRRQHTFNWRADRLRQSERIYIVHTQRFTPVMSDALEMQVLDVFQWWRAGDLADAGEPFTPRALANIVADYMTNGAPQQAPEVEIVVD